MAKKLEVVITGNTRGLSSAFGEAESQAGKFSSKMSSVGSTVNKAIGVGALGAAGALAVMGPQLIKLGGQLDSWALKVDTVFEGSAASIRKWADKNNEVFGITDEELAGLAASFGDLLKPMGFTAEQAARMSQDVVGLSGALSEWTGGTRSAAEVSDILAKAMLGEREGLKELGIAISEADVQARLATKGQEKLTGAALAQAKAIATQELIFEKSTDAQKAFAAGGNETIRAGNKLKAIWGEVQVFLAQKLVPIFAKAGGWLADRLPGAVAKLRTYFAPVGPLVDRLAEGFGRIAERLRPVVQAIGEFIAKNPGPVFGALAVVVGGALVAAMWSLAGAMAAAFAPIYLVIGAVALLAAGAVYAYQHFEGFRNVVDSVANFITEKAVPAIQQLWHWFQDYILPVLARVAEVYVTVYATAFRVAIQVAGFLVEKLKQLYDWFSTYILPTLIEVVGWLRDNLGPAFAAVSEKAQEHIGKLMTLWSWLAEHLTPVIESVAKFLNGQFADALKNSGEGFVRLVDLAKDLWNWLSKIVDAATSAGSAVANIGGGFLGAINPFDGGKAAGGPVSSGRTYLVGERGPELLTMGGNGFVTPNHMLSAGPAVSAGTTVIVTLDGREIARHLAGTSNRSTRATGRSQFVSTISSFA